MRARNGNHGGDAHQRRIQRRKLGVIVEYVKPKASVPRSAATWSYFGGWATNPSNDLRLKR